MSAGGEDGKGIIIKASYGSVFLREWFPQTQGPAVLIYSVATPVAQYFWVDMLLGLSWHGDNVLLVFTGVTLMI